jgi:glyoxylase-like metal-dependent hydrolase (beta-lactamase superfamily II)
MLVNAPKRIAPDVAFHPVGRVNVYFIGRPGSDWILVDTGTPHHAREVRAASEARYGRTRPRAIVLTHGHFDHSGNAWELAQEWDVPVYAHPLELPYLTGRANYPQRDPLVGGFLGIISIFLPKTERIVAGRVAALPEQIPGFADWRWLHTPGHSPGHISLFRESDGTLVAGDAVATVNMETLRELIAETPELSRGPIPFNCDWQATIESIRTLAQLRPRVIAAGHGLPMSDPDLPKRFIEFAEACMPPDRGRYVLEAARGLLATFGTAATLVGVFWMLLRIGGGKSKVESRK